MPDFNPFDIDFDGDVDAIDLLGSDQVMRHILSGEKHGRTTGGWNEV